jgi:hypothetical protein
MFRFALELWDWHWWCILSTVKECSVRGMSGFLCFREQMRA